jgi:hypothetical protein
MAEEPIFIQMDISHYGAMLKLKVDEEDRATVTRLHAEAERKLATCAQCEETVPLCEDSQASSPDQARNT